MDVLLTNQLGIAALVSLLIEWAKNSRLPWLGWINHRTALISRLLSMIAAAATAAGLAYTFDGGVLTVSGITAWSVLLFFYEAAKQFALQEVAYRGAVKGPK